jgi:ribosomal protein L7/L12
MYADPRFKPLPLEAVTLLNEGRVIEAIKSVREAEQLGLKEAKGRVDA